MSQPYPPPPPPPQNPYGQQTPPPGYPPAGYPGGPGYGTAPSRTSGAAIASLICGILLCIPVLTQLLAIILGFVGIKSANRPGVSGKGLAITGLILGLLGLLGWAGFGATIYYGWQQAKAQMAQQAQPFVNAIAAGDVEKAKQYASLSEGELESLREQMSGWGNVTSMSMSGFNFQKSAERPNSLVMTGNATFEKAGTKEFEIVLDTSGAGGQLKIIGVHFK